MPPIRFFTDEDVYGSVARKLRENGFDAVSTPEANCLGENDESQLEWAAQEGRVFLISTSVISPASTMSG
jgi:uncharacterized protein with PIN domain